MFCEENRTTNFFIMLGRTELREAEMENKKAIAIILSLVVIVGLVLWARLVVPENHLPLYEEITSIKNRLTVNITKENFTNPVRVCDFYELREEGSEDYFQTTVDYWVFQHGQGEHGDVEAFVEIYNAPNRTDLFIVEVARFSWDEITVSLDGSTVIVFPPVTDNSLSLDYQTFQLTPK